MRNLLLMTWGIIMSPMLLFSQNAIKKCHTTETKEKILNEYPELKNRLELIEEKINKVTTSRELETRNPDVTIPVVVHIVYKIPSENITNAQVQSQIDALNRDFNKENSDIKKVPSVFSNIAANCNIRFQLATIDPHGIETYGIARHYSDKPKWAVNDDIKKPLKGGFAPWNPSKYLNIWVCNMGGDCISFSSFPGMPAEYDGIVVDYRAFGTEGTAKAPYNMGRTCVHEVGHFLGLFHIWGDSQCGNDYVEDTPRQEHEHNGVPQYPQYSYCSQSSTIDMFMNYMDYVSDKAMVMFTEGQRNRMLATLKVQRASLIQSDDVLRHPQQQTCIIHNINIEDVTSTDVKLSWDKKNDAKYYILEYKKATDENWQTVISKSNSYTIYQLDTATTYECRVKQACENAISSNTEVFTTLKEALVMSVSAFPNPFTDYISLTLGKGTFLNTKISIIEASTGQMKFGKLYNQDTPSVNVNLMNFGGGVYLIVIEKDNQNIVKKMTKLNE